MLDGRVLAMRADPPEQYVDLSGDAPLQPIELRALFVTATYGELGEYGRAIENTSFATSFTVCLPPLVSEIDASPQCPDGSPVIASLPKVPAHDSPLVLDPPLALLQEAAARDPLHGLGGLTLRLQMSVQVASSGAPVVASKDLSFQLAGSPVPLNHALELTGMERSDDGAHSTLGPDQTIDLVVAQFHGLRPLIGPGEGASAAIESYSAYDNQGHLIPLTEHVTYAFYSGTALFFGAPHNGVEAIYTGAAGDVADEPAPGAEDPPDGLVTAEPVYPGDQGGAFWVVARDGRGGVAWSSFSYYAKELRGCGSHCPVLFFGCN